jgi:LysM repeat protein
MADRNPTRLAAPLALLLAAIAVLIVVQTSRQDSSASSSPAVTQPAVTKPARRAARSSPRAYVVKAGDSLSLIAEKTDVSLEELQRLNPDLDPQALQTGQRLKLSP